MRFMDMVMEEVMKAAGNDMAVFVKMNMRDWFLGDLLLSYLMLFSFNESDSKSRRSV